MSIDVFIVFILSASRFFFKFSAFAPGELRQVMKFRVLGMMSQQYFVCFSNYGSLDEFDVVLFLRFLLLVLYSAICT